MFEKNRTKFSNLKPQNVFLIISVSFGLLLAICTPPFEVPDEINHFYRAYQVASGDFSSIKQDNRLGGYISKDVVNFATQFRPYIRNMQYNSITPKDLWEKRKVGNNDKDFIFKDFANTALYSYLNYFPQSVGIFLGRFIGASPFWLFYLGRVMNLLFYAAVVFYAIKIIPIKKWLFVVITSLPMSLSINSSLSADLMVNAISFMVIAYLLNLIYNNEIQKITVTHFIFLLLLSVLLGMAKLVYVPILFICILVPIQKFKSKIVWAGFVLSVLFAGFGSSYLQKSQIDKKYIPYSDYNISFRDQSMLKKNVDINKQVDFIKDNPEKTVKIFVKSFFREFRTMASEYVGILGWSEIQVYRWFVWLAYLLILVYSVYGFGERCLAPIPITHRFIYCMVSFLVLLFIMLSQYLSWDLIGEDKVYPLQGRYFIPVFPIFFMVFYNLKYIKENYLVNKLLPKVATLFSIFSGSICLYIILKNGYTFYNYDTPKWKVELKFSNDGINAIGSGTDYYILDRNDTIGSFSFPALKYFSSEKVFTSPKSLLLTPHNPFGYTLKLHQGNKNDKIIASCRSNTMEGVLVVQEIPDGLYFQSSKVFPEKDSLGWKYREAQFILPHNILPGRELRIYFWNPGNDSIFLDEYKVVYYKKNS